MNHKKLLHILIDKKLHDDDFGNNLNRLIGMQLKKKELDEIYNLITSGLFYVDLYLNEERNNINTLE